MTTTTQKTQLSLYNYEFIWQNEVSKENTYLITGCSSLAEACKVVKETNHHILTNILDVRVHSV